MTHQASLVVGPSALGRVRLSVLIVTVAALAACSEPEGVAATPNGEDSPRGQSDAGSGAGEGRGGSGGFGTEEGSVAGASLGGTSDGGVSVGGTSDAGASAGGASAGGASAGGASAGGASGAPFDGPPDLPWLLDAPEGEAELRAFLDAGSYRNWAKEAEFHLSTGPHGGSVRTYYSPKAAEALRAGAEVFPAGAAAVKEAANDAGVYGQSVWIKVQAASDAGQGFFWYERFQRGAGREDVYGNARGSAQCVGCHSLGHDYDRSTLPFE